MPHVFISYKHEDLAFAQELTLFAQRRGMPIWLDTSIQPGEEWRGAIDKAIAEAFAVVVIMTPEARLSDYITYEWAFAMGLRIPIIPVLLRPTQLHPKLEVLQYLDFTRGASTPLWIKLIERLQAVQGAQPPRQAQMPMTQGGTASQSRLPTMEEEMRQSIINFYRDSLGDPVLVFGLAKDIVRRLGHENNVFESVETKIARLRRKWIFAARDQINLEYALALVKGLGLSPATPDRNQIFLQMGMPDRKSKDKK